MSSEQASKRLRLFVPAAAEIGRKREAAWLVPKHHLSIVRSALRLGRQVAHASMMPAFYFDKGAPLTYGLSLDQTCFC